MFKECETGVYYGWSQIGNKGTTVYPMVMSLGWNPYYNNEKKSAEVHILNEFSEDFYGESIRIIVTGYIRPEQDYPSLGKLKMHSVFLNGIDNFVDALVTDIRTDIEVARHSLKRKEYKDLKSDKLFTN